MALGRVKTWIAEVLTASDLNAEFNNVINNALSLISPLTGTLDANGNEIVLDADGDTSITADTDDRIDIKASGTDVFKFDATVATPVNGLQFTAAAASSEPDITAFGSDTDISINQVPKGAGKLQRAGVNLSVWQEISARTTASSDATIAFTWAGISYKMVVVQLNNILPATDDVDLYVRTTTNATDYDAGASDYSWTVGTRADIADAQIICNNASTSAVGNVAGEGWNGLLYVHDPSNTSMTTITASGGYTVPAGTSILVKTIVARRNSAANVDGIQFSFSSGNIASGEFIVWGIL